MRLRESGPAIAFSQVQLIYLGRREEVTQMGEWRRAMDCVGHLLTLAIFRANPP